MANTLFAAGDTILTFASMTAKWKSFRVEETSEKFDATCADDAFIRRGTKHRDCAITIRGLDTTAATGYTFAEVQALVGTSPSALTFTDDAGTPATKLRSDFFTDFPLAKWVVDNVSGEWSADPAEWEATLTPNNDDI